MGCRRFVVIHDGASCKRSFAWQTLVVWSRAGAFERSEVSLHIHEALLKPPPADSVDCGEPIDTHSMRTLKKLIEEVKSDFMTAEI
jgi:hypothetical protein